MAHSSHPTTSTAPRAVFRPPQLPSGMSDDEAVKQLWLTAKSDPTRSPSEPHTRSKRH